MEYKKQRVVTDGVPKEDAEYTNAVKMGPFVFVAGIGGKDAKTGELIKDDLKKEIEVALTNIKTLVEAAGGTMENVVKTYIIVKNEQVYQELKKIRQRIYPQWMKIFPASTAVLGDLIGGANIEIEAVAIIPDE